MIIMAEKINIEERDTALQSFVLLTCLHRRLMIEGLTGSKGDGTLVFGSTVRTGLDVMRSFGASQDDRKSE